MPKLTAAPAAIGLDDVTNGYVPWSRSSSVPCAPSNSTCRPFAERAVDEQRRVGDVGREPLGVRKRQRDDLLDVERLDAVDPLEPDVLLARRELDLLAQDLRVEQVLDADPDARRLVGVRGPDPAPRRADLQLPEPALARAVERDVPRHDQVGVAGDEDETVGAMPARLELVELVDQHLGVDDAAGADRACDAR